MPKPIVKLTEPLDYTEKGHLNIALRGFKSKIQISRKGTVQVYVADLREKKKLHSKLEEIFGRKLKKKKVLSMSRGTVFMSDFPLPERINFPACSTTYSYRLTEFHNVERKRHPNLLACMVFLMFCSPVLIQLARLLLKI